MINVNDRSQFNDALGFLKRLDLYFRLANICHDNNDLYGWSGKLSILYLELCNFVPEKEREVKEAELRQIKDEINNWIVRRNSNPSLSKVPSELYWKVFRFQSYLKKIYGDSGLETKMLDSAMDALK